MINALSLQLANANHVRCFLHFKDNLKSKLIHDMQLPVSVANEFIADILGKPSLLQLGLVDADSDDEFIKQVHAFKTVWDNRESMSTKEDPKFHDWFLLHCSEVVRKNMLKPVRSAAGLGDPPRPYYTNSVESLNKVAKLHTKYQKHQLPEFISMMQD